MRRVPLVVLLAAVLALAGCSDGDDDDDGPSATVETTERTTTSEARTPEEEVKAAYLRSWDVYAKAALTLDASELDSIYAGGALEIVSDDIAKFRRDNTPAKFSVDHDYRIDIRRQDFAAVRDDYVNHSVLLDPETMEPIEPDPNKLISELYLLERIEGEWKVVAIQEAP